MQGLHRIEKYLNLESFLEKSLKIKSALKSTEKSLKAVILLPAHPASFAHKFLFQRVPASPGMQ